MDSSFNLNNSILFILGDVINTTTNYQNNTENYSQNYDNDDNDANIEQEITYSYNDISDNIDNTDNTYNTDISDIYYDINHNFRRSFLQYINNLSNTMSDDLVNNFIDSTLNTSKSVYKKIPNEIGLSKIEEVEYRSSNNESQNMCPIFCLPFEDGEIVCKLPCKHIFSKNGIYRWFNENNQCPVCRFELDYKEVKVESSDLSSNNSNSNNELPIPINNVIYYNRFPSFNLVNILLQQEEIEYQQALIRSLSEN